ncbi:protein of unknown function [Rhodococcus sp. RD6.2]|nr:protein of unknown function [Rhodococcus sp. RD6.2]
MARGRREQIGHVLAEGADAGFYPAALQLIEDTLWHAADNPLALTFVWCRHGLGPPILALS